MPQLKKLSVKTVYGKIKLPDDVDSVDIMRIIGVANATKTVTTTFGDSTGLKGQFKATTPGDDNDYRASTAWLPDVIIDEISLALSVAEGEMPSVQFAYDITAVRRDDLPIGYEYICTPLIKEENNPFENLEKKILTLAAPTKPTEKKKPKEKSE